jgi:chemotaxis protein CheD
VASNDTAGNHARKVYYIPSSGDVFLKRITKTNNDTIQNREKKYLKEARKARTTADISFF